MLYILTVDVATKLIMGYAMKDKTYGDRIDFGYKLVISTQSQESGYDYQL